MPNAYSILAGLCLSVAMFFYGQHVKEVEMTARYETEKNEAVRIARADEQKVQGEVNELHKQEIHEWRAAADSLADSLIRLQQRSDRPGGMSSNPRAECQGASGRELSRKHAEILERYAYRCQVRQIDLKACIAYAESIKQLNKDRRGE